MLALAGVLALAPGAPAQTDQQRSDARAAATGGAEAFQAGRWAEALDLFQRAESLVHAPPHLLYMARAQVKLGLLVEARENYRRLTLETLAANAPRAFQDAQAAAQQEIGEVEPRLAAVKVVVRGAAPGEAVKATVDGAEIPSAVLGISRPMNPGQHRFRAAAPGKASKELSVAVKEGGRSEVVLELVPDASAPAPEPAASAAPAPTAAPEPAPAPAAAPAAAPVAPPPGKDEGGGGSAVPAYVAFGVGAVGLGLGTVFALQSSSKRKEAEDLCVGPDGGCPVRDKDKIDGLYADAGSAQTLAIVGFAAGGVGLAAGVVLLLVGGGSDEKKSAQVQPWVGAASAGIAGRF